MFADIAGYTALMQCDEALALDKLRLFKEELTLKVQEFEGKIIQYYGDGCLIIFTNAVDAVSCAKALQEDFTKDPQVPVRIGIHLGDILLEEGNIFGDSVNISSRIQSMGIPGAVLFSDAIKNQIKNKPGFQLTSLGNIEFKNVDDPIEVFALSNSGFPVPDKTNLTGKFKDQKNANLVTDLPTGKKKFKRRLIFYILLAVAILTTGYIILKESNHSSKEVSESNSDEIIDKSIAVLAFIDLSPGKDAEYLCDGIANDITTTLYSIKDLKVIGNTSSFSFKGKNEPLNKIGEILGVANILEGSVQKEGKKIRVTAKLIRAADGFQLWADKYDKDSASIFKMQDDITNAVVMQLKLKLLPKKSIASVSSTNPEVYNLILQGNYFAGKRDKESMAKALDFYLKALAIDSLNARSWAGVAKCYTLQSNWGWIDWNLGFQKARHAANKSIELDSTLAEGYRVLGALKMYNFDWVGAEEEYQKALSLEPGNAEVLKNIGLLYRCTGRIEESIHVTKQSITLDPLQAMYLQLYGMLFYYSNHLEEAIVSYKKNLELNPQFPGTHFLLGKVYLLQGKTELALAEMAQEVNEGWRSVGLILTYQALGRKKEADKILSDVIDKSQNKELYFIAEIYAYRGEKDKAFEYLEKSFVAREPKLILLNGNPLFKNLESDPRYKVFLKKMNLPVDKN